MTLKTYLDGRVQVAVGDITKERVDAIVNAANSSLMGGGGVDGAIHRAGGPAILDECKKVRKERYPDGLPTGEAVITTGGKLKPRVIHTVGPIYGSDPEPEEKLASCYRRCLEVAVENGCRNVAFPAISTGVYGYPKDATAGVTSGAISQFLAKDGRITLVRLVFYSQKDADVFIGHCTLN